MWRTIPVFALGLLEDWNVGVSVFPEREEILIRSLGLGGVALHGLGPAELKRCRGVVHFPEPFASLLHKKIFCLLRSHL
jgi:hypothetical protein